jgi:hypothetical protein
MDNLKAQVADLRNEVASLRASMAALQLDTAASNPPNYPVTTATTTTTTHGTTTTTTATTTPATAGAADPFNRFLQQAMMKGKYADDGLSCSFNLGQPVTTRPTPNPAPGERRRRRRQTTRGWSVRETPIFIWVATEDDFELYKHDGTYTKPTKRNKTHMSGSVLQQAQQQ